MVQPYSGRKVCVMSNSAADRSSIEPTPDADTPEAIEEMMAEAARVDALFQSGKISTILALRFAEH